MRIVATLAAVILSTAAGIFWYGNSGEESQPATEPERDVANAPARPTSKESLEQRMKSIYQDSVIEEGMGSIASAKQKWKMIIAQDLPKGKYSIMARGKLKKYGDGP